MRIASAVGEDEVLRVILDHPRNLNKFGDSGCIFTRIFRFLLGKPSR